VTTTIIIIVVLAIIVLAVILTPPGRAIRTAPRRHRAAEPDTSPTRGERPFRRPRAPKP
jgi:hypothetical protein